MSTYLYATDIAKREATEPGSEEGKTTSAKTYVDMVAALVPAEVLALNAFLLTLISATSAEDGKSVTTISDFGTAKLIFWASIVACLVIYLIGDLTKARKEEIKTFRWVILLRAPIPALAYVAWTMLVPASVFVAVAPDLSEARKVVIAAFGAIGLALLAKTFGDAADAKDPQTDDPPKVVAPKDPAKKG